MPDDRWPDDGSGIRGLDPVPPALSPVYFFCGDRAGGHFVSQAADNGNQPGLAVRYRVEILLVEMAGTS
jgi:hypothetical protein